MRHVRWEPKFGMEMGMVRVRIYRYGLWCRVRGLERACGGGGRMDGYFGGPGICYIIRLGSLRNTQVLVYVYSTSI